MTAELDERTVDPDPFVQFARWYDDAVAAAGEQADAMVVATASGDGAPSARMVLLRGFGADLGFRFYTNFDSAKGHDLVENPRAALVLHWPDVGRQVRATGAVTRLDPAESEQYWRSRPRLSRLSARASRQSAPVASRAELEAEVARVAAEYPGDDIPLPPFWGGYRVDPEAIEFWQHRDDRLHDRVRYRRGDGGGWRIDRLAP